MPEGLVIKDIRLPELDADLMTPVMRRSRHRWHVLTVTVHNASDATPFCVMSDIRKIRFDASRRALLVQFSEEAAPSTGQSLKRPVPPRCLVVGPGEEATLRFRLSSPITFLRESADGEGRHYEVRIDQDVDTVECTVAYGTDPPARTVDLNALELLDRWKDWGSTVHASWNPTPGDSRHRPS